MTEERGELGVFLPSIHHTMCLFPCSFSHLLLVSTHRKSGLGQAGPRSGQSLSHPFYRWGLRPREGPSPGHAAQLLPQPWSRRRPQVQPPRGRLAQSPQEDGSPLSPPALLLSRLNTPYPHESPLCSCLSHTNCLHLLFKPQITPKGSRSKPIITTSLRIYRAHCSRRLSCSNSRNAHTNPNCRQEECGSKK